MSSEIQKPLRLAILDYGMGNLRSVARAFEKVGAEVSVLDHPDLESNWDAMILPGVGALGDCVKGLHDSGLDEWIRTWIAEDRPFFGICLGLQALFDFSEEGNVQGLGILKGKVVRFRPKPDSGIKVPHMGWNSVRFRDKEDSLHMDGIQQEEQFYFDHSYHVVPEDSDFIWGLTDYEDYFVSAIRRGNCFATQFHPEKSQAKGLQLYRNFLNHIYRLKEAQKI